MSSQLLFAAIGAPALLGLAGLFVFFVTKWTDRRERDTHAR